MTESPLAPGTAASPGTYRLDPGRSTIRADVKGMFGLVTVHGTFRLRSGEVVVGDDAAGSTVQATIDAGSYSSGNATRDRDVVSGNLLDASAYPDITFAGQGARQEGTRWIVPGVVTAHGMGVPTDLIIGDIRADEGALRFRATTTLERAKFGVTKKKGLVGSTVALTIDAVAVPA